MNTRKVLALGPPGSGKSWFLNQILGRNSFVEGSSSRPTKTEIATKTKTIRDNVNGVDYELELIDTVGGQIGLPGIVDTVGKGDVNQLVLVCAMPYSDELKPYLKKVGSKLLRRIKDVKSSLTLVINNMSTDSQVEDLFECRRKIIKHLNCMKIELMVIVIKNNEPLRDATFNYMVPIDQQRFQFANSNFLSIVSNSSQINLRPPKTSSANTSSKKFKIQKISVTLSVVVDPQKDIRNILAIGPVGCGKSWFLNQILGRKQFEEASSPNSCTRSIKSCSKSIRDNVNDSTYHLNLYDTPAQLDQTNELDAAFNQIALVVQMAHSLDKHPKKLLGKLIEFGAQLFSSSNPFTLVINKIHRNVADEALINFFKEIQRTLGPTIKECICVYMNENIRDCVFRYLINTKEDGYQFHDRNFLAIVGASPPVFLSLKKRKKDHIGKCW